MSSNDPYFEVLVVDDEPDMLQISKMVLKNLKIYGAKIKVICCNSKQEAIDFLSTENNNVNICVALIDVVMETENSGLELCDYIRNDLKDHDMNLIIRTGQPGSSVENTVVQQYEIDGYLNKAELNKNKLFSTVHCCIKNYMSKLTPSFSQTFNTYVIAAVDQGLSINEAVDSFMKGPGFPYRPQGLMSGMAICLDGKCINSSGTLASEQEVQTIIKKLEDSTNIIFSEPVGNTIITQQDGNLSYKFKNLLWIEQGVPEMPLADYKSMLVNCIQPFARLCEIENKLRW